MSIIKPISEFYHQPNLNEMRLSEAAETEDARKFAEVKTDYLSDINYSRARPTRAGKFLAKAGDLLSGRLGTVPLFLVDCSGKARRPETLINPDQIDLIRKVVILKDYLAKQKVVDLKKLGKGGVFVAERILKDPSPLASYPRGFVDIVMRNAPNVVSDVKFITIPMLNTKTEGTQSHPKISMRKISSIVVLVPAKAISDLEGTRMQRRAFDSAIYHEVEGHAADFYIGSKLIELYLKTYADIIRIHGFKGYGGKTVGQVTAFVLEDANEIGAFLKELDRLVTKFDYIKNPSIFPSYRRSEIEFSLKKRLIAFMMTLEMNKNASGAAKSLLDRINAYILHRISLVSEETRKYVRKILRDDGWNKPIPF